MILNFLTQLLKRDNTYPSIFSSALEEGIVETFKEMGYSCDKMREKRNNENENRDCNSKNDDITKHTKRYLQTNILQTEDEKKLFTISN